MLKAIYDSLTEISKIEKDTVQVTDQVKKLIDAIGDDTLSSKALMDRVGVKHRPTFRNNYLLPAIELGYIEMTLPEKPSSSKQRHRRAVH